MVNDDLILLDWMRGADPSLASEAIVETEPHQMGFDRAAAADERVGPVRQIDEQIVHLRRYVRGDAELDAATSGPAGVDLALGEAGARNADAAEGDTERAVEQHLVECEADAGARAAEPGIGELPRCEG